MPLIFPLDHLRFPDEVFGCDICDASPVIYTAWNKDESEYVFVCEKHFPYLMQPKP